MIELHKDVKDWFEENWYDINKIDELSLEELKELKDEVIVKRQAVNAEELATKTLGNAGYGACANPGFYFFNPSLAGDITGECRELTKFMWNRLEKFFHEEIWDRKDLHEKFDIDLDMGKRNQYQDKTVSCYSDTDSTAKNSLLLIKENNIKEKMEIEKLWEVNKNRFENELTTTGQELLNVNGIIKSLNYKNGKLYYAPIKRIIRHKVSKPKFKIKTKSGKEIIVTGDHSCIVFRNGEQLTIKAKDINIKTDKILSVINNNNEKMDK